MVPPTHTPGNSVRLLPGCHAQRIAWDRPEQTRITQSPRRFTGLGLTTALPGPLTAMAFAGWTTWGTGSSGGYIVATSASWLPPMDSASSSLAAIAPASHLRGEGQLAGIGHGSPPDLEVRDRLAMNPSLGTLRKSSACWAAAPGDILGRRPTWQAGPTCGCRPRGFQLRHSVGDGPLPATGHPDITDLRGRVRLELAARRAAGPTRSAVRPISTPGPADHLPSERIGEVTPSAARRPTMVFVFG